MNKTLHYEYVILVNVNNINIRLLACPYTVHDLNLLKSTERLMCVLWSQAYSYLKPLIRGAGYMEAVFLHHAAWDNLGTLCCLTLKWVWLHLHGPTRCRSVCRLLGSPQTLLSYKVVQRTAQSPLSSSGTIQWDWLSNSFCFVFCFRRGSAIWASFIIWSWSANGQLGTNCLEGH